MPGLDLWVAAGRSGSIASLELPWIGRTMRYARHAAAWFLKHGPRPMGKLKVAEIEGVQTRQYNGQGKTRPGGGRLSQPCKFLEHIRWRGEPRQLTLKGVIQKYSEG
jgi:hypothetical protein